MAYKKLNRDGEIAQERSYLLYLFGKLNNSIFYCCFLQYPPQGPL